MDPTRLSDELRHRSNPHLSRRRAIVGLSFLSAGCMELVGLYQMGLIGHLPEPPGRRFDADKVDASAEAYEKGSMPDAFLGLTSYGVTAMLAAMGEADRARSRPWIPLAMGAKTLMDAGQAAKLTRDQFARHKAACFWCLLAVGATFGAAALAMPEAVDAGRHLLGRAKHTGPAGQAESLDEPGRMPSSQPAARKA